MSSDAYALNKAGRLAIILIAIGLLLSVFGTLTHHLILNNAHHQFFEFIRGPAEINEDYYRLTHQLSWKMSLALYVNTIAAAGIVISIAGLCFLVIPLHLSSKRLEAKQDTRRASE